MPLDFGGGFPTEESRDFDDILDEIGELVTLRKREDLLDSNGEKIGEDLTDVSLLASVQFSWPRIFNEKTHEEFGEITKGEAAVFVKRDADVQLEDTIILSNGTEWEVEKQFDSVSLGSSGVFLKAFTARKRQ